MIPFDKQHQLLDDLDIGFPQASMESGTTTSDDARLPGYPTRQLSDTQGLEDFLLWDLTTPELDSIAPRLWMMSTYSSGNINPLHYQKVKAREVVICEYSRLHLTWKHSQIFIKPLPKYLLSHAFWGSFLVSTSSPLSERREKLVQAAKGLLRTYYYLIKYESDFDMAQSAGLLPRNISWEDFSRFISQAQFIRDWEVSPRYHYGEIRLTRLNFYAKFFLNRWRYEWGRPQYSTYFNRFYGHVLFVFAILSLLLGSLQVELAAESLIKAKWSVMGYIARYFSAICLVVLFLFSLFFTSMLVVMIAHEWIYAIRAVRQKERNKV
ncbi:hypothetical protein CC80DRAFT_496349 [Byssothecium circinans]|uniref:Subtilisin-like serine protease protein n=1 Tax=Byssothecium circinans TaxID=147558 RepID=A0A6A5TFD9_9PLEO|nr:hypothetical protein CC80DRAFT_496349 [Byssothecium circinans]